MDIEDPSPPPEEAGEGQSQSDNTADERSTQQSGNKELVGDADAMPSKVPDSTEHALVEKASVSEGLPIESGRAPRSSSSPSSEAVATSQMDFPAASCAGRMEFDGFVEDSEGRCGADSAKLSSRSVQEGNEASTSLAVSNAPSSDTMEKKSPVHSSSSLAVERLDTKSPPAEQRKSYLTLYHEFLLLELDPVDAALAVMHVNGVGLRSGVSTADDEKKKKMIYEEARRCCLDEDAIIARGKGDEWTAEDWKSILDYFGSFYAVNKSFLIPDQPVTKESPSIDYAKLTDFHSIIRRMLSETEDEDLQVELSARISQMCDTLQKQIRHVKFPHQLRFAPILLGCRFFEDWLDFGCITEVLRTISLLDDESKAILETWCEKMPVSEMRQHVTNIQQMITLKTLEAQSSGTFAALLSFMAPILRHALAALRILYNANVCKENKCEAAINYEDFKNDAVNASPSLLRHDFTQWFDKVSSPDFGILQNPFVLDSANKALTLKRHASIQQAMQATNIEVMNFFSGSERINPHLILHVRRSHLVGDTLHQLAGRSSNSWTLKKPLRIKFVGEEGVDEGGVQKEFFQLLIDKLFNPDYGMFVYYDDSRLFWFKQNSFESHLQFELIGTVFGLAIYNGVILGVQFPLAVYKKLLHLPLTIKDLAEFEPQIARSVNQIRESSAEQLAELELNFSVDVYSYGLLTSIPLSESREKNEKVTIENRGEYCDALINWYLREAIAKQFDAFEKGFRKCCDSEALNIFRGEELQLVIVGSSDLNFEELEKVAEYQGGYTRDSETVQHFWQIAHSLSLEDKKKLLGFCTGSDRVPIRGLSAMQWIVGRNGPDSDRLPTAQTCFNYLLLPDYKNLEKLRKFLFIAIENYRGFGLM